MFKRTSKNRAGIARRASTTSKSRTLIGCTVTLALAGCDAKTASFFEALAEPPTPVVFDCAQLNGVVASFSYEWVSSTLPGEDPLPADFTVPGTFMYSGTMLNLRFPDSPAPISGNCTDGVWTQPGTGPVAIGAGAFADEQWTNTMFRKVDDMIEYVGLSTVTFAGTNVPPGSERRFRVIGSAPVSDYVPGS